MTRYEKYMTGGLSGLICLCMDNMVTYKGFVYSLTWEKSRV